MAEYIDRDYVLKLLGVFNDRVYGDYHFMNGIETAKEIVEDAPVADVQPIVRCKDCKHFHLDYFGKVNGANIIVAHEICDLWAGGCKTVQNAFCSNGVRKNGEDNA